MIDRLKEFVSTTVWNRDLSDAPLHEALFFRVVRIGFLAFRSTGKDKAFARASTLTLATLMSLPPVLALAFGLGKSLGVTDDFRKLVESQLGAEQEQVGQVVREIFTYVDETPLAAFNGITILFLLLAVVKLLGTIENAFNEIFSARHGRSFLRKIADYLSVLIIAPIFLTVATGVFTTIRNQELVQKVEGIPILGAIVGAPEITSLVTISFCFFFLYIFMPNTKIQVRAAMIGAVVAGGGWLIASNLFLSLQLGIARTNLIYGSFAGIPIMLLWLHVAWSIVLVGLEVVAAIQNENLFRNKVVAGEVTEADLERYGLSIMVRITQQFDRQKDAVTEPDLIEALLLPQAHTKPVLNRLIDGGLLVETAGTPPSFVLSQDPRRLKVTDVLRIIRGSYQAKESEILKETEVEELSRQVLSAMAKDTSDSANDKTLLELARNERIPAEEPQKLVTLRKKKRLDS